MIGAINPKIAMIVVAGAACIGITLAAYHAGKWAKGAEIRAAVAEARIAHKENAAETENEIENLSDPDLLDELDQLLGGE